MRRPPAWSAVLVALGIAAGPLSAQLRPLEPIDWAAVDAADGFSLALGVGVFTGQRASLAGTEGRLLELGAYTGTLNRSGFAIQFSGTAVRVFRDDSVFAEPVAQARVPDGTRRVDAGDQRISTLVRLTDGRGRLDALFRFGVRLPTTDNEKGLERDQTDFFATLGGRYRWAEYDLAAEIGLGVLGTRSNRREQVDPILYSVVAHWNAGWISPELTLVGQYDTRPAANLRGNEDLAEIRLGLRTEGDPWVRLSVIRGIEAFSPAFGMTLEVGIRP